MSRAAKRTGASPAPGGAPGDGYVDGAEAARLLGVRRETLYAYASRGLVRRVPVAGRRAMAYAREDLERLRTRAVARSGHGAVAGAALQFGEPVLASAITAIDPGGPLYRGALAVDLARSGVSYEAVAERLWHAPPDVAPGATSWEVAADAIPGSLVALAGSLPAVIRPIDALSVALPWLALADPDRHGANPLAERARGRRLLPALAALMALGRGRERLEAARRARGFAAIAAVALGPARLGPRPRPELVAAVERALVLVADHELNASAFAARVAAGTGADLYACLSAAVATATGPAHGTAADRVVAITRDVLRAGGGVRGARAVVSERTQRGEGIPGFGHRLYPDGDPRGPALLDDPAVRRSTRAASRAILALVEVMAERRERPNVDAALAALVFAHHLPPESAAGLFVLGRTAGWIAHVLEQRTTAALVRPRALYVGERPAP